jgi:hypothetical protein
MNQDAYTILESLLDYTKLPTYSADFNLSTMATLAEEAYKRDSVDGYFSYVLMTNQICEELARLLVRHAQFTLLLHIVPRGFNWKFSRRETGDGLSKLMFGKLLEILDNSMEFEVKADFIEACRKVNEMRNKLAHQFASNTSLDDLRQLAAQYKSGYDEVGNLFNQGDDEFTWHYSMMLHDIMWDHLIAAECNSKDSDHVAKWMAISLRLQQERANSPISGLQGQSKFIRNH